MPRGYSPISLEKSDVYTMGNILYYTLSMGFLWPDLESVTDAVERTKNGERSPFDSSLIHSQDPSIQAMIQSIQWSWTQDPDKRPRAVEVQMYLRQQLETILGIERLTLDHVRVQSIEPLPSDHSFSDGDFKIMFKSEKRQRDIQRRRKKLEQSKTKDRPKKDQRRNDERF